MWVRVCLSATKFSAAKYVFVFCFFLRSGTFFSSPLPPSRFVSRSLEERKKISSVRVERDQPEGFLKACLPGSQILRVLRTGCATTRCTLHAVGSSRPWSRAGGGGLSLPSFFFYFKGECRAESLYCGPWYVCS